MSHCVALYLRVSTKDQNTANQRLELERWAAAKGYNVAGIYEDHGISGSKGRAKRPGFDRLLKDAARRKFDIILAWSVDRIETEKIVLPWRYVPPIRPLAGGGEDPRLFTMASACGPEAVSVRIMNCPPDFGGP